MKYKCKNCGQIYSEQTEYCDCGNNIFEEILEASDIQQRAKQREEALNNLFAEDGKETQKPDVAAIVSVFSLIIAIIIFVVLMLKACTMPAKNTDKAEEAKIETEMPEIDSFWDNTAPKTPEQPSAEKHDIVIVVPEPQKTQTNNTALNTKPATDSANRSASSSSTVQKPASNNAVNQQNEAEKKRLASEKRKLEEEKRKLTQEKNRIEEQKRLEEKKKQEEIRKQKEEQQRLLEEKRIAEEKEKQRQRAKELSDYKNSIRNTLFANFPVLTVSGSGSAQIGFSISSDGQLLNRRFVSQSNNKSLDDAMYHMLMRTPSVKKPPSSYSGEDIIMKMDFNNGSYSFSYVK
ncbi:MAG: TonB C-terminal domain-containing protein [Candidatus Gastranaerophilales bacterium]|nr:TonB C-terminal domain-containing protein [Candidatus Gastranaerophilales bacterium]